VLTVEWGEVEPVLIAWVREWFDLLAAGRPADACARLDEPNANGTRWTPALLRNVVEDTFAPGTRFRAEHPEGPLFSAVAASIGPPQPMVGAYDDGSGFWVEHKVPLNGEYSDLTAQFEFRWRGNHRLAAILHDLHVL
jgi:hypothetical protein